MSSRRLNSQWTSYFPHALMVATALLAVTAPYPALGQSGYGPRQASYGSELPPDVQQAFATSQGDFSSGFQTMSYESCDTYRDHPTNAWGGYSIGDFFSTRLQSRRALVPIAGVQGVFLRSRVFANPATSTLEPSGYFRTITPTTTSTGTTRFAAGSSVFLPGSGNQIQSGVVSFTDTGATLPGTTVPVQQAGGLVLTQDGTQAYGGFFASSTLTISDTGPFVAETAGTTAGFVDAAGNLQQVFIDATGNIAQTTGGFITPGEDLDGDGNLDLGEDTNGDGILEPTEDVNGDGVLQPSEDRNGNGVLDVSEDLNRNGVLDAGEDLNGNNRLDPGEDTNGNNRLDLEEDRNGNGILDPTEDTNGNAILDLGEDTNGNGVLDRGEDLNANGILDPSEDANGNGVLDAADTTAAGASVVYNFYREVVLPAPGDQVGRLKIAENNSPIPRDRWIFDYTYFDNAAVRANGNDVQRFAPGFEKTFFNGQASLDMRFPFASTIESKIVTSSNLDTTGAMAGLTNADDIEFGNISAAGKFLIAQNDNWAMSAGAQVTLPTAEDVRLQDNRGGTTSELLRIENESVHVMPFLAVMHTPNDRTFLQYYAQYDIDTSGNTIVAEGREAGSPKEPDFLYLDFSAGYWLYRKQPQRSNNGGGDIRNTFTTGPTGITGFAPRFELHYNRALDHTQSLTVPTSSGNVRIGNNDQQLESLNMNIGATLMLGADRELSMAWGTPIVTRDGDDFEHEVRFYFNWLLPN